MNKVAITGANGFIGSYLIRSFTELGEEVKALMRPNSNDELILNKSLITHLDYTNLDLLKETLTDCNLLIHTAALTKARTKEEYTAVNVDMVEQIVDIINSLEHKIHFIFLSSQAAGGMPPMGKLMKEDDEAHPLTYYGESKLEAENIIKDKCEQPWTIIRPVSVYGPGEKDFLQYFKMAKNHIGITIGKDKLANFISAEELCEIITLASRNEKAYKQVFNANDGKAYFQEDFLNAVVDSMEGVVFRVSIPDLLLYPVALVSELVSYFTNKPALINFQKVKEFRGDNWVCSIEKTRSILGFRPSPNLQQRVNQTYSWYKEHKWF